MVGRGAADEASFQHRAGPDDLKKSAGLARDSESPGETIQLALPRTTQERLDVGGSQLRVTPERVLGFTIATVGGASRCDAS